MDDETHLAASSTTAELIIIFLEHNSLRNDTYDCDWAGIHFRIFTPTEDIVTERLTSIYRWNKRTHEEVLVAEWLRNFEGDKFKFTIRPDMPKGFQLVKDVYPITWGSRYSEPANRTFLGENGKRYTWKERTFSLKLYRAEGDNTKELIAEYHRPNHFFRKRKAILKLQPEALEFLDSLIITFMYSEGKRRYSEGRGRP